MIMNHIHSKEIIEFLQYYDQISIEEMLRFFYELTGDFPKLDEVNRLLNELIDEGLIERVGNFVRFVNSDQQLENSADNLDIHYISKIIISIKGNIPKKFSIVTNIKSRFDSIREFFVNSKIFQNFIMKSDLISNKDVVIFTIEIPTEVIINIYVSNSSIFI